jgi:hypothetical protein
MGIRTSRAAEKGRAIGDTIGKGKVGEAEKKKLQDAYLRASTPGERLKIKGQIEAHNKRAKDEGMGQKARVLSPKTLDSIRDKKAAERRAVLGD